MPAISLLDGALPARRRSTTAVQAPPPVAPAPAPVATPAAPAAPSFLPGEQDAPGTGYNQGPAAPTYNTSQLEGFDTAKLNNPAHGSTKYSFARIAQKYAPTPQGWQQLIADPEFQKLGLQSVGNGVFRMPDGTLVDAIRGYNAGGFAWQWAPQQTGELRSGSSETGGYGTAGGGSGPGGAAGTAGYLPGMGTNAAGNYGIPGLLSNLQNTDEFTDPTTSNFEDILNARVQELMNPVDDQARQQYANLLQQYITGLSQPDQGITDLIKSLQSLAGNTATPSQGELTGLLRGQEYQTLDPTYAGQAQARIGELQQDPYTGAEWEAYRTHALDPIEADRTAAIQRALAQSSDQGITPESGITQALLGNVNRGYDASRAAAQNDLAMERVSQRQERRGEAFDIQTALADMLQNRQLTGLDVLGNTAQQGYERQGLSASTYGALADILPARQQQQLEGASQLSQLSGGVRTEERARRAEAVALQALLAELPGRSLQQALATLGMGEMPGSMVNSLINLTNSSNQANAMNQNQTYQNWGGLSSLLGYLAPYLKGNTGPTVGNQATSYGNVGTGYE